MFGWRARVGLVLPADNAVAEPEFYSLGVEGVSFHTARLSATDNVEMRAQAADAAMAFKELGVDILAYACAETSFDAGERSREQLVHDLNQVVGVPVVTATEAMLEALTALELRRVALVTPYAEDSGELFESTLTAAGVEVTTSRHSDFRTRSSDPREWYETNRQPPTTAYQLIREVGYDSADGVLVAATNFATLPLLQRAENDLGKPVVACNQAILWWCLRQLRIHDDVAGYGQLLRRSR